MFLFYFNKNKKSTNVTKQTPSARGRALGSLVLFLRLLGFCKPAVFDLCEVLRTNKKKLVTVHGALIALNVLTGFYKNSRHDLTC